VTILVGAGSVARVGILSPVAGLALSAGLVVVGLVVPLLQAAVARRAGGRLAPLRGDLGVATVDLLHGLPDLVAYGAVDAALDRIGDVDTRLRRAEQRSSAAAGTSAAVTAATIGLCVLVGLGAGTVAVRSGTPSGELLAVIVLTPLAVFEAASGLPAAAQRFAGARSALRRLAEVFAAPPPVSEPADPVDVPEGPPTLRLQGVTAGWTPARTAVQGIDLVLAPGRRVALVGPSGSGKSTIAALLVRFLDPAAGRVTLDGIDLRRVRSDRVRQLVGHLPEDAYLFDTTIGENLRIGRRDATDAQLRAALAKARLADWVDGLPRGLDTLVGEHGMQISGGQRRRLALARALLADFAVLILDEPTEHLDDETAAALTRDLLAAAGDRTVLLITHRTDVLSDVDEVVSLPDLLPRHSENLVTPRGVTRFVDITTTS
jgi:thiol reductant ABC exporter CydC subunit